MTLSCQSLVVFFSLFINIFLKFPFFRHVERHRIDNSSTPSLFVRILSNNIPANLYTILVDWNRRLSKTKPEADMI